MSYEIEKIVSPNADGGNGAQPAGDSCADFRRLPKKNLLMEQCARTCPGKHLPLPPSEENQLEGYFILHCVVGSVKGLLRSDVFETCRVDNFPELSETQCSDGSIR